MLKLNLVEAPLDESWKCFLSLQAKAQEELEKEQYRKFLAKFTAENFLKKVEQIIIWTISFRIYVTIQRDIL